ncbi:hypothetical protein DHD32_14885 [Arenibacter sp. TNZ]|jgi:hypothetical protein|nr:hypothetical protein [Arenibacter sp. TNZ]
MVFNALVCLYLLRPKYLKFCCGHKNTNQNPPERPAESQSWAGTFSVRAGKKLLLGLYLYLETKVMALNCNCDGGTNYGLGYWGKMADRF